MDDWMLPLGSRNGLHEFNGERYLYPPDEAVVVCVDGEYLAFLKQVAKAHRRVKLLVVCDNFDRMDRRSVYPIVTGWNDDPDTTADQVQPANRRRPLTFVCQCCSEAVSADLWGATSLSAYEPFSSD
jgi:hypothetical protein